VEENKKTVEAIDQHQLEKEYEETLANGTKIKVKISIQVENYNKDDLQNVISDFAADSRNFYFELGKVLIVSS